MADGYSMSITAVVTGPDDGVMFTQAMTWEGMNYSQLVDLEEAIGHAVLDSTIALGRNLIGASAARVAKK